MKIIKFLIPAILSQVSCTPENKPLPSTNENQQQAEIENRDTCLACNFRIQEYQRSMYNKPYLLKIIPSFNHLKNEYQSIIFLTQQQDTILNKPITIDSLIQNYFQQEADTTNIDLTHYNLINVELSFIRAYNLYFNAIIEHKSKKEKGEVLFQIDYLRSVGKMFVNKKEKTFYELML